MLGSLSIVHTDIPDYVMELQIRCEIAGLETGRWFRLHIDDLLSLGIDHH